MQEIKAVLFDLDDTLFDHRHSCREGLRAVWKRYTCFQEMTLDELEEEHSILLEKIHFSQVLVGKLSIEEARAERFKFAFLNRGVEVDFNTANNAADIYRRAYVNNWRRSKGSEELLKALHNNFKIGIITNNLITEQKTKLEFLELEKYVDMMLTSEEAGVTKPDPVIFKMALEKMGLLPRDAVMIGDSWEHDIVGAHSAGIKCIWLNLTKKPCPDTSMATEIRTLGNTGYIKTLLKT